MSIFIIIGGILEKKQVFGSECLGVECIVDTINNNKNFVKIFSGSMYNQTKNTCHNFYYVLQFRQI
jgi:hypothetical protein